MNYITVMGVIDGHIWTTEKAHYDAPQFTENFQSRHKSKQLSISALDTLF